MQKIKITASATGFSIALPGEDRGALELFPLGVFTETGAENALAFSNTRQSVSLGNSMPAIEPSPQSLGTGPKQTTLTYAGVDGQSAGVAELTRPADLDDAKSFRSLLAPDAALKVVFEGAEGVDVVDLSNLPLVPLRGAKAKAGDGDDVLIGGAEEDRFFGQRGRDALDGGAGDDRLHGNRGADTLTGGQGDDVLTGGAGADHFVFAKALNGHDLITDFDAETDTLVFDEASEGQLSITDSDVGALISYGYGDTLVLAGVAADSLSEDCMAFV
ncbi:MAG: hypothetical protein AAFQ36_12645 [Pseudomonadota bacterium]